MSEVPLSILKFIGENMHNSSKLLNVYRLCNIIAIATVTFFIVCGLFKEKKLKRYAEYMESFSAAIHVSKFYY